MINRTETDYFTQEGATELARRINAFWTAKGKAPVISLHRVNYDAGVRGARFDIRSDMLNGKPRG